MEMWCCFHPWVLKSRTCLVVETKLHTAVSRRVAKYTVSGYKASCHSTGATCYWQEWSALTNLIYILQVSNAIRNDFLSRNSSHSLSIKAQGKLKTKTGIKIGTKNVCCK